MNSDRHCYNQLPSGHALFHVRTTVSMTKASLLRVENLPSSITMGHELFAVQAATESITVWEFCGTL